MFELNKHFRFESAHVLKYHKGKCGRPHGHSYELIVSLRGDTLCSEGSSTNMIMDFNDITTTVKPMIETYFDHHWINETLQCESPTAEFIAQWIFRYLKPRLPLLNRVTVNETTTSSVTYWE